ncbi:MAG: hypothetical protein WCJ64_16390 [Rhodospirillaceae bacterium]
MPKRDFEPALNLGAAGLLPPNTLLRPAMSRRIALPPDGGTIGLGAQRHTLTADQSRLLAAVLAAETTSIGELVAALPTMDVPTVAWQLAMAGLVGVV